MRLKEGIEVLMTQKSLDKHLCKDLLFDLLDPENHPFQKVAFLVLLRSKKETAEELVGMVTALQEKMIPVSSNKKLLDIVGTGGDSAGTVNISTGSAILAAACGVAVAKHGNVAVTSRAGSADVLKALGINIDLGPEKISAGIDALGIGFCFAPNFHPILRELRSLRQQLNVPTSFNLLGPLLNPARPQHLLMGIYDPSLLMTMSETLQKLGTERSMIVHGNGIDELSCIGPVQVIEVTPDDRFAYELDPQSLGFERCTLQDLQGGTAAVNAALLRDALQGQRTKQARLLADTLIFNAAVAVYVYGLQPSVAEAIPLVRDTLLAGSAVTLLNDWVAFSND